MTRPTFAIAALMLMGFTPQTASQPTIPEAFRDKWEPEIDDCANVESGTRVVVFAQSIAYLEARDTVLDVAQVDANTIRMQAEYETYDGSERRTRTLTLSDQQETLTFSDTDGSTHIYMRCPQGDPDGE